jgi:hypothetical protein
MKNMKNNIKNTGGDIEPLAAKIPRIISNKQP